MFPADKAFNGSDNKSCSCYYGTVMSRLVIVFYGTFSGWLWSGATLSLACCSDRVDAYKPPRVSLSTLGYNIYSVDDTVTVLIFSRNINLKILLINMIQERIHILCHRVLLIFVGNLKKLFKTRYPCLYSTLNRLVNFWTFKLVLWSDCLCML